MHFLSFSSALIFISNAFEILLHPFITYGLLFSLYQNSQELSIVLTLKLKDIYFFYYI